MTSLSERDKKNVWHPFDVFPNTPTIPLERSEGLYLYTKDGRKIRDMVSSWWVNLHGHNHPHIVQAIQKQAEQLSHAIFSGFTHEPAVQLAERLLHILPNEMDKLFFSDNGSTALEVGVKMALQYWHNWGKKKQKIIAFEGGYHGDTFGAMSLAGPLPFNKPFEQHLFKVTYLPFPTEDNWTSVKYQLMKELYSGQVAALVYEPMIQGVGGMRLFDRALQDEVLQIAKANNALLIADEVMTGFGRTGKTFASEYLKQKPDIICLSKGITGGFLPLGATATTQLVFDGFTTTDKKKIFLHGHSYTGNALACAAANASLDLLLGDECQKSIAQISKLQERFCDGLLDHPALESASSLGTILSMELETEGSKGYFASQAEANYQYFLEKGYLLRPMGNVIYLSPPYCTTNEELKEAHSVVMAFLNK